MKLRATAGFPDPDWATGERERKSCPSGWREPLGVVSGLGLFPMISSREFPRWWGIWLEPPKKGALSSVKASFLLCLGPVR